MTIFFDSKTNNVNRFISNFIDYLQVNNKALSETMRFVHVRDFRESVPYSYPYGIITYTTNFGQVPKTTSQFLNEVDTSLLYLAASSGNRNWGNNFAKAADLIGETFQVETMKFEMSGLIEDYRTLEKLILKVTDGNIVKHIYP